ncbi:hypothetical protein THS5294_02813 [Thalassobacter stenotrophicus]|uniref:Uncharacterized protein n=3 Tax=Roseobacteraceae TaxID=2854170 RepID=A0A0U1NPJ5_9RHOB|nr:hypothetical protein NIG5292_02452 [Nereida ignava]CUH61502.1 hypothetical protein THS5294_02813 [Thalassobacter stenotrophicus]SFJ78428.1 hypothetical protein SAMN02745667_02346 [Nereida ignava DSM 16309]SHJ08338.1 hypothetical protein SAMN02744035_02546 [Thalassobacter stenotrophicus DSM 16310]
MALGESVGQRSMFRRLKRAPQAILLPDHALILQIPFKINDRQGSRPLAGWANTP